MTFDPTLIRTALRTHTPADETEAGHLRRFEELILRREPPLPNDRNLLPPLGPGHLTASVFVVAGSGSGGKVLLLEHPKLGRLLQPGGHLEPGESDPRETAARELLEETGHVFPLTEFVLIDFDIHTIPASPRRSEVAHEHFDVRYVVRLPSIPTGPAQLPEEEARCHWLPLQQLQDGPADTGLLRVYRKLSSS
jgi:8-oxo-dGTP pyrophosphatase MutT (NUDIX family)